MSDAETGAPALDIQAILGTLPHRFPFVMVDRVLELQPGQSAHAIKCVSINEPFFQGHFPEQPILPGVLISEAFAQVAGIVALSAHPDMVGRGVFLMGLDKMRFRKPVRPGDVLHLYVHKDFEKRSIWSFKCRAEVDGKRVADGGVMATVADAI
jgi:3-hydroxyacyl-[acyl-carrier-protein] dehydratase